MNEQALQDAFNLFTKEGYNGTFNDYKELIKTNEGAFNDSYGLFKNSGYNGSLNDFGSLMGLEIAKIQDSASVDPTAESSQENMGSNWANGSSGQLDSGFVSENNRGKREKRLKESEYDGTVISRMFDDDPNNSFADNVSESFKDFWKGLEKNNPVFMAARRTTRGPINPLESIIDGISNWVRKDDAEDEAAIKNNPELFEKYNGYRNNVSLEKQAEQLYNNKDLNISDTDSNLAYNTNKATDFVNEYYINNPESKKLLEEANVNASDFQGFLNRKGYIEEFIKQKEAGGYKEDNYDFFEWMHNDPELNYKDLTMQQDLKMYFDEYLIETASRNVERVVLEEIKNNPSEYKGMSLPEAMEAADVKLMEDPEKYNYGTHLDFNKLEDWNANNWNSITKYREDQIKNIEEEQASRIEETETGVKTGLYGTARTIAGAVRGLGDGLEDAYDFFKADGKMLGFVYSKGMQANEFRDLREKSNRRALRGEDNINYLYAEGKQVTLNGKEYIKQANGTIKQITNGFDVSKTISDKDRKAIDDAIEKGDYTYGSDFDGFGGSIIAGQTIGELAIQVVGQKGLGSLRKLASLKYLGKAKNLSKARLDRMKAGVNSKGNMRGVNYGGVTGGAKGTWDTFGKKIPLGISKEMADAVIFQSGYGAMTGYNQAKTAALDAGMGMEESEAIANEASLGMAALFALTTPINPRTGLIDKIFKETGKNSTANLFKQLINASGNAAGVRKNFGKIVAAPLQTRLAKFGAIVASEGAKEMVQENIQQVGEVALNKVLNKGIDKDLLKDTYTYEDFVNTSALSFAAGGFAGGVGNISTLAGRKNIMNDSEKVQKLRQLMQNPAKVEKIFDSWVKNGDITRKEADGLNQEIQKFGRNINKMPKFLSDRRMSTDLLKVIDSQENISKLEQQRKNAIPGEQALIDEKLKVLKEQQTKLLVDAQTTLDADNEVFEGKFTKNTAAVVNFARKLGFGESKLPRIFENTDAYVTAIYSALKIKEQAYLKAVKEGKIKADPDFKPLTKAEVERLAAESDGVYLGAGNLFINKEIARQTGKWTVTSHEIIHPILNSLVGSYLNQKANYDDLMKILPAKVRRSINKKIEQTQGKEKQATEFLNYLSDAVISGELDFDPSLFDKIRLWFNNIISKLGLKSGIENHEDLHFDDARGVYNWLKEFTSGLKKGGEISDKAVKAVQKAEVKANRLVSEDPGLRNPENAMQLSKTLSPEQTSEVTNDILAVKQLAEEEAAVAAKFGKEPIKGGKQARLEQKVISTLKPIIDKVVTNRTQALYDPIAPDAKKAVSRQEFQESMRSDLEVMILNEYNGSQDIEKFLINRGYLRANNLAKRLGIESQEDGGIKSDVTAAKDVALTEDVQTIDRSGAVERGQATFDQLDLVDDALISDIEKEISRELKMRSAKGTLSENVPLKLNNKIYETSWIEDFIDKTLFKKILKKWGAIGESNGKTKIPGAYIDFLNDQKNFDIIMKALPVKTIKKSYSKLFTLEKIGRELTAEGNPIFRVAPIDKKTFLQYFLDGKKTTILERQKQLAREIITPVAKETLANYATPENLSNLKEMQQLAPDTSLDLQAGIIINAQLEDLQSKLDRYKGEEKGFDVIQFSKNITPEGKKNIASALKDIVDKESNLSFNQTVAQDILNKLDGVKTFKDLAGLLWNAGDKTLGLAALREYRAELLKLLTNKLYYLDANIPKFIISAVSQGHNKVFGKQQKVIGYAYAMAKVATNFENAKDNGQKAIIIENFLKFVSRSIRTLKIDGITTNKAIYNDLLVPIMGDPTKYGFTLTEGKVGNRIQSYINKDGKRLYGLADITRIKSDFENSRSTINKEAIEVREWLMNEAKEAIKNKDIDAFIGFLSLLSADQRGVIRKMSSAGFSFANLILNDTVLEHETEALDIFNAWKSFAQGKLSKVKLIKFLKESKVNLVSKEFDGILKEARKEVSGAKNIGKARYKSIAPKTYIANLKKKGLILQPSKSQGTEAMQLSKTLNKDFNNIIENETKISAKSTISEAKSRMLGKNKGGWRFFVPPSADDFAGLMYRLLGKGDTGNKNAKWFKDNLFDPFGKGIRDFESYKQQTVQSFRNLKKSIKNVPKNLGKTNETGFTNDVAIRVYLWNKKGIEIPGLDKNDIKELIDIVNNNQDFKNFADQVENLLQGYPEPENNWLAGTITTDVINKINTSKREEFLQEWQANADEVFSKENINKLRAAFGEDYVEALKDMLYRMKTGRNRPSGSNKLTNQFMNWVNDSVGTIMFFNTRSALLQTLSIANFINWGDNNPINAAKAFANQKQFWSDFTMIFNSDFLKQRRSGLKTDINADDIASAAETSTNKAKAALSSILKMGFLPTQIADSFAIAIGGASFLRNRIDSYIKEGLSQQEAESRAFLDFQEIAEETQQSSRPDRISQQQASPLGRIILAFANTPMQYMRLTKKAILDIKNKRGDLKTNISKIVYYTAIQNIIFASLQSALFASLFDDEDEEAIDNKQTMVANSMLDTLLRGMGIGGAIVSTVKNIGLEIDKQSKKPRPDYTQAAIRSVDLSPPLSSKLRKLMSAGRAFSYKNVRDKMQGFSLENPAFYAGGQVVSAVTNVPLDRVIKKADNIRLAMDNDTKLWQKIALALGYSTWDVGIVQKEKAKGKSGFGKVPTWKKTEWKKVKW